MTLRITILIGLLFFTSAGAWATSLADEVRKDVPFKSSNLFVYKTNKKFAGARVEILSMGGELITSHNLHTRKVIIDFGDVDYGTYIIRISKGNKTQEFQYVKK